MEMECTTLTGFLTDFVFVRGVCTFAILYEGASEKPIINIQVRRLRGVQVPESQSNCVENTRVTQTMYMHASPTEMDIANKLSVWRNGDFLRFTL